MAKKCMKIAKSTFLGHNSDGTWMRQANFLGSGETPPVTLLTPSTRRNPEQYTLLVITTMALWQVMHLDIMTLLW